MFHFQIINQSNYVLNIETVSALAVQISRDFSPLWGVDGQFGGSGSPSVALYIQQKSDVSGALGYHDIDSGGNPYIKVFVDDSAAAGVDLSSVISHEILEVLGDPFVDSLVLQQTPQSNGGTLYFSETCDPVENDIYEINGVKVSNFVTPQWFMPVNNSVPGVKYDFLGNLKTSFSMTPGGYFITYTATGINGPNQVLGRNANPWNGKKL